MHGVSHTTLHAPCKAHYTTLHAPPCKVHYATRTVQATPCKVTPRYTHRASYTTQYTTLPYAHRASYTTLQCTMLHYTTRTMIHYTTRPTRCSTTLDLVACTTTKVLHYTTLQTVHYMALHYTTLPMTLHYTLDRAPHVMVEGSDLGSRAQGQGSWFEVRGSSRGSERLDERLVLVQEVSSRDVLLSKTS